MLAVRETKPSGPRQLVWAARTVLDLGRPDEAKKYLKRLLDASPNAATLADLQRHFGSGLFVRFLRDEPLRPEGQQLGQAVLNAATAAARDPARLKSLIAKLTDPDPDVRRMALVDLREADDAAAAALIGVLADSSRAARACGGLGGPRGARPGRRRSAGRRTAGP